MLQASIFEARVIPNGVDLNVFKPASKVVARRALELPEGALIILYVVEGGDQSQFKDHGTVSAAVRKLSSRQASKEIVFICLGGKIRMESYGRTTFQSVSYLDRRELVAQYYQASDICLHAAHLNADTFPTVILEALACGTPVVATVVGGIPEMIDGGVNGFLVPAHDSDATAARVLSIAESSELRNRLGHAASTAATERFGLEKMADAYFAFYELMLADARARSRSSQI